MDDAQDRLQIGEFAELVGLSIPQLRRYDRLRLLEAAGRSAESGYRYYSRGQTGAARVIALLRSMDMPIAEIRRIVSGAGEPERRRIFRDHRARLEARLDEVRRLLEAVDAMTEENDMGTETCISSWLHLMPRIPVTNTERSIAFYQEALGLRLDWRTADGRVAALSSGDIETLLLVPWSGEGAPPPQAAYVYVEDPDALCAEYEQAGADIVSPVATRAYGMRDFVVRDPDGHTFTLGRGTERLRDVADQYGISPDQIAVNPDWLERRKPRT
ncbi:VOC family protein [Nonomuraea sp. 3N208]|uniref:VOC family protein n=1 Tax=Nonomuraea sp. 3N208 TaxID=3457421 RepID=UPI003FD4B9D2